MTMRVNQQVEETARKELAKGRFDGSLNVQEFYEEPCFSAGIDAERLEDIALSFNPEYEKEKPGKIRTVVRDIIRHEINHKAYGGFNGCPRNLENHVELIVEPIAKVLVAKDYAPSDIHYIANVFEDTILQIDLSREFALDGQIGFWDDVGRHTVSEAKIKNPKQKFSGFYEAHVRLNLYLWGNKRGKKELRNYFQHKNEVNEAIQNFLERTGISELRQKVLINGREVEIKDRQAIREFLNDEKHWPRIAEIYAEEFSKLMQPGYALPLINHSGKGTKGKTSEKTSKRKEPCEGNPFDKAMYGSEFKKRRMRKAYENDEGIPLWIDSFEALDLVYQNLAQRLNIKVETFTKQTSMPIYYYGIRPFDPDKDNLKQVTFGFDDKGRVELKKKRWHEDMPLEYKIKPSGFPEVRFCLLDTSASMKANPQGGDYIGRTRILPWGDNSKYHYGLLAWYGLLEYLRQNHLLKKTSISLANFSDKTLFGEGLDEAKKIALKPQFGWTHIDVNKIKKVYKNRGALVFTISDGEIQNWDEIKDAFIRGVKKHHYFHLQIGHNNETTEDLEKNGLHVEYIENARDLATKVIDLTDKLYRG